MSKVTFHCMTRGLPQGAIESGLTSAKFVNVPPPDNLPPGFVSVWRWVYSPDNANSRYNDSPELVAADWLVKLAEHLIDIPKETYIEILNEPDCENAVQADWLNRFYLACMQRLEAVGRKCAIFSFGTGRPSLPVVDPLGVEIWTALTPAMRYAKQHDHICVMHGYEYDPRGVSNFLRYRAVYKWLPADARPRLFIGEWGIDGNLGPFNDSRWRTQRPDFDPDVEYMRIIREYDAEVMRDDYVIGFSIFTLGGWWPLYEIANSRVPQMVLDYVRSNPTPPSPVPTPTPTPTPDPDVKVFPENSTVKTTATKLNLRTQPHVDEDRDNIIAELPRGTVMNVERSPVVTDRRDWVQAETFIKVRGYVAGEFLELSTTPPVPTPLPTPAVNLLRNASFENGTRPVQSPFISGAWPPDWEVDWYYTGDDPIIGTGSRWALPEMIVIEYLKQFPEASHLHGTGKFILKCFWNASTGFGWRQTNDLPAGRYRFTCPIEPDHWHVLSDGRMVRPSPETSADWYLASEVYASVNSEDRNWLDARDVPIGVYTELKVDYDHAGGPLTVRFGARGRWPMRNTGWMFDDMRLELRA